MQMIPSNDYGHANSGLAKKMGKYDMVVQPNVVMKDEYCMNYIATTAENYDISYVVFITAFVNICGIKLKVNLFFFILFFFCRRNILLHSSYQMVLIIVNEKAEHTNCVRIKPVEAAACMRYKLSVNQSTSDASL